MLYRSGATGQLDGCLDLAKASKRRLSSGGPIPKAPGTSLACRLLHNNIAALTRGGSVIRRLLTLLALAALLVAPQIGPARAATKVVATFTILADLVREVGRERVEVSSIVGHNADAHAFEPSPEDARRLKEAALVVANGLGLDGWINRLARASGTKAPVLLASAGVKARTEEGGHGHGDSHDTDPHAWQDVANTKVYIANIRDALVRADAAGREAYVANASAYLASLDALDREIRAGIASIPASRREVITTHDAFGYFGRAYGIRFTAPVGVSTSADVTAAEVARIIRQIRARKIPAVFLENISDRRLADRIAAESGARIGGRLYTDALTPADGPAPTYLAMMRANLAAFRTTLGE